MRLLFQNARTDKERGRVIESVHDTFLYYGINGMFDEYEGIVNGLKSIRTAILEKRGLRDTTFVAFRVTTRMMSVSLSYIEENIDSILNVWDIGIRQDYIRYRYYYDTGRDVTPSVAHTLLEGNDVYGLMGMRQLLPDIDFGGILRGYVRSVCDDASWNHIVDDLYHHDAMPHPDHFITIRRRPDDSYASIASFPFDFRSATVIEETILPKTIEPVKYNRPFLEKFSSTGIIRLRPRRDKTGRGHGEGARARRMKSKGHDFSKRKNVHTSSPNQSIVAIKN